MGDRCPLQRRHVIKATLLFTQANHLPCRQVLQNTESRKQNGTMVYSNGNLTHIHQIEAKKWNIQNISKMIFELNSMVSIEVIETEDPIGKLIVRIGEDFV